MIATSFAVSLALAGASSSAAPSEFDSLHAKWDAARAEFRVPGLGVAIVRDGRVVDAVGFGLRAVAPERPVTPDTIFYIASSTKAFTAFAVCQLADAEKLDLDGTVATYLPRFALADPEATRTLTLRDLLSHRAGLDDPRAIVFGEAFTGLMTEDLFYRLLPQTVARGRYAYNNLHFTLLGRVIEARSGKHWKRFLKEQVFLPAGMKRTTGNASEIAGDPDVAVGLHADGDGWRAVDLRKVDSTMHAAGGLSASVADLGRWIRLNLGDGAVDGTRILSAERCAEMRRPYAEHVEELGPVHGTGTGLGWHLGTLRGEDIAHHSGDYTGFHAHVSFLPQRNCGVAVVTNGDGTAADLIHVVAMDVYDHLLGGEPLAPWQELRASAARGSRPAPEPEGLVEGEALTLAPEAYAGAYDHDDYGRLEIELRDGELEAHIGNLPVPLHAASVDSFHTPMLPGTPGSGVFEVDEAGGKVTAVELSLGGSVLRFERR